MRLFARFPLIKKIQKKCESEEFCLIEFRWKMKLPQNVIPLYNWKMRLHIEYCAVSLHFRHFELEHSVFTELKLNFTWRRKNRIKTISSNMANGNENFFYWRLLKWPRRFASIKHSQKCLPDKKVSRIQITQNKINEMILCWLSNANECSNVFYSENHKRNA